MDTERFRSHSTHNPSPHLSANAAPHPATSHTNGRSPVWVRTCFSNPLLKRKLSAHTRLTTQPPQDTHMQSRISPSHTHLFGQCWHFSTLTSESPECTNSACRSLCSSCCSSPSSSSGPTPFLLSSCAAGGTHALTSRPRPSLSEPPTLKSAQLSPPPARPHTVRASAVAPASSNPTGSTVNP